MLALATSVPLQLPSTHLLPSSYQPSLQPSLPLLQPQSMPLPAPGSQDLHLATAVCIIKAATGYHDTLAVARTALCQWRTRANGSDGVDVTFFKPGSLPTTPLLLGESPSRQAQDDITERWLRYRHDNTPATTASKFRITWGTFDYRLAPFAINVVAHIVDNIDSTCTLSSIAWSPSAVVEPRVTTALPVSTSRMLHTEHCNQLTVSNDGVTSSAVLAYLLSHIATVPCCEGVSSVRSMHSQYFADGSLGAKRNRLGFPLPTHLLPDAFYFPDHKSFAAAWEPWLMADAPLAVSTIRHVNCTMFGECGMHQSGALQCQTCTTFHNNTLSATVRRNKNELLDMAANPGTRLPSTSSRRYGPALGILRGSHGTHMVDVTLQRLLHEGYGLVSCWHIILQR